MKLTCLCSFCMHQEVICVLFIQIKTEKDVWCFVMIFLVENEWNLMIWSGVLLQDHSNLYQVCLLNVFLWCVLFSVGITCQTEVITLSVVIFRDRHFVYIFPSSVLVKINHFKQANAQNIGIRAPINDLQWKCLKVFDVFSIFHAKV